MPLQKLNSLQKKSLLFLASIIISHLIIKASLTFDETAPFVIALILSWGATLYGLYQFRIGLIEQGGWFTHFLAAQSKMICILLATVFTVIGTRGGLMPIGMLGGIFFVHILVFAIIDSSTPDRKKNDAPSDKPLVNGQFGTAEFANSVSISNEMGDQDKGLYIGFERRWHKSGHLLTTGGAGKGKGTCLILPTLLVDPFGSYFVTDPKGENAIITARHQKDAGQKVFIIDPWNEQKKHKAIHGIERSGFNPFAFVRRNEEELRDFCEQIATYIVPINPEAKDPYWDDRARSLIRLLLMHIITELPEEDHNFWTLYKMLRYTEDDWLVLLYDLKNNQKLDGLISIGAGEWIALEKSGNTLAGIKSAAQNATTIFESPQLRESLAKDDFKPEYLTNGNCTVYLVIPERYLTTHATWLRLVTGLSLMACNARPNKRVNFILDEFAVLGKMQDILKAYAFARGQNISLWAFVQSLSQLKTIYGEDGMNTLIGNSNVFQALGAGDNFTARYVSDRLGETTQLQQSVSYSTSTGSGSNSSGSSLSQQYQAYKRMLMTPEEVSKSDDIITFIMNKKIIFKKWPYYKKFLTNVSWDEVKQTEGIYTTRNREWYEDFKERADPPPRILD